MTTSIAARLIGRRPLLRIGGFGLDGYTLMLYLGSVAGVLAGAAFAERTGLDPRSFALASVVLLIPALVGARLLFVFQHIDRFRDEPRGLWRRGEGGSSLYGGLVLAVLVSLPVLGLARLEFGQYWDAAAVSMLVGLVLTRIGCLLNGCCAGRPTSSRLGLTLPDLSGRWRRRYPTPLLEATWALVILGVALLVRSDAWPPGAFFAALVAAYAAGRLALEPTRAIDAPRGRRENIALSTLILVVAAAALVVTSLG